MKIKKIDGVEWGNFSEVQNHIFWEDKTLFLIVHLLC